MTDRNPEFSNAVLADESLDDVAGGWGFNFNLGSFLSNLFGHSSIISEHGGGILGQNGANLIGKVK